MDERLKEFKKMEIRWQALIEAIERDAPKRIERYRSWLQGKIDDEKVEAILKAIGHLQEEVVRDKKLALECSHEAIELKFGQKY